MKALRAGRLGRQRELFNAATATLHQMGMSDVFAVLLLGPACFESAIHFKMNEAGGGANSDNSTCDIGSINSPPKKQRITSKSGRLPLSGRTAPRFLSPGRGSALSQLHMKRFCSFCTGFSSSSLKRIYGPTKILIPRMTSRSSMQRVDFLTSTHCTRRPLYTSRSSKTSVCETTKRWVCI
jgi:hypothetical protein